jgi:hypothetical protein
VQNVNASTLALARSRKEAHNLSRALARANEQIAKLEAQLSAERAAHAVTRRKVVDARVSITKLKKTRRAPNQRVD